MRKTICAAILMCSILFVSDAHARNRIGKYISANNHKRVVGVVITLHTKGIVILKSPRVGTYRGNYSINGNKITFKFKSSSPVINMDGFFDGNDLITYMFAVPKGSEGGEADPKYPNGYRYKKSR